MSEAGYVCLWTPGRRTKQVGKTALVSALILLTVLGSIGTILPGIVQALAPFSSPSTVNQNSGCSTKPSNNATASTNCSKIDSGSNTPQSVGANAVPNLSLPKTVVSSVDSLISDGGVIQDSPQNLTLYNLGVSMRLLGGLVPHDELLGPGRKILSGWSFWGIESVISGSWTPLLPVSSDFSILGTNTSGTSVLRTMQVSSGVNSGTLRILYRATPSGELKWDLTFIPGSTGQFRLVYALSNLTQFISLAVPSKKLDFGYNAVNYTLSWGDVADSFNTTAELLPGRFALLINLGRIGAGSPILVDPTISGNVSSAATANTYQRKVFFEPKAGYYWAFYYDGAAVRYRYSKDGIQWYLPSNTNGNMPTGWPVYSDAATSSPYVFSSGQTVVVASGTQPLTYINECFGGSGCIASQFDSASIYYSLGTLAGNSITWQPDPSTGQLTRVADTLGRWCTSTNSCSLTIGTRHVSVTQDSSGRLAFSYNWYANGPGTGICNPSGTSESAVVVIYNSQRFLSSCSLNMNNPERSAIAPSIDGVRVVYQEWSSSTNLMLLSRSFYGGAGSQTVNVSEDTYVDSVNANRNTVFGGASEVVVYSSSPEYSGGFLKFSQPSIPSGGQFASAVLSMTWSSLHSNSGSSSDTLSFCGTNAAWYESTATFANTLINPNGANGCLTFSSYVQGFLTKAPTYDVSIPVSAWYNGGSNYGLLVEITYGANQNDHAYYFSKESSGGSSVTRLNVTWICCMRTAETISASVPNSDEFSASSDANFGTHVLFRNPIDGTISYAYRGASSGWIISPNIFLGSASNPTLTVDYSTNDVYAFAITSSSIIMKRKTLVQPWSDFSPVYPVTGRTSPVSLGSNFISASSTNSSSISIIWTEGPTNGPFSAMFASIPIQTVWSPYTFPSDPWDSNGISPYGQYFANLGEQVSPFSGMLTIRQSDLNVPGRGLDLHLTRVYTEPYSFLSNVPYNFENYPWAPVGLGWQFNFPWLNNTATPLYVHLGDGQGYRIPSTFWSGLTATFENHQGDSFRLVRNIDGSITLYTSIGVSYAFDPGHKLNTIVDPTGNNTITFSYANNLISCITDTVGRAYTFSYSGGLLQKISEVNGTCVSPGSSIRNVVFGNNGQSLTSVADPANRLTNYTYQGGTSSVAKWLLSRITYPTGWYTNYTYTSMLLGTQSTTYRVGLQLVASSTNSPIRQLAYVFAESGGDQVTGSTITTYNGTQIQTYTTYTFSFAGDVMMVSDASHNLLRGIQQVFGVNGQIPREIILVSDGQGHIGSYTNFYRYDLWGNQIYSRHVINNSTGAFHENFNSYYNDGEPPGFYAFQDSFSQNQGTRSDNSWNATSGFWMVNNGVYNGTETSGGLESMVSSSSIASADLSLQSRVYAVRQINVTAGVLPRLGIFAHYTAGKYKWALDLTNESPSGTFLELHDEWYQWLGVNGQPSAKTSCPLITGAWYTFNMTVHGSYVSGWARTQGQATCYVSGVFSASSPAAGGNGFGLSAGGYSALFDDVQVATVSPMITGTGFSNAFVQNGSPGPIGLNTWLTTTKPPGPGWNTTANWLGASAWGQAYPAQNYGAAPWGTLTGWSDNSAQWIWATTNADVLGSLGPVWFRRTFSVSVTSTLNVAIATDDTYIVYLDGSKLGTGNNWQQVGSYTRSVGPGYHVLAINATNTGGPAGLLVSMKNTGTGQVIIRSDATAGPVISALAGLAQLQNGLASQPEETYYSYYPWGGLNQTKSRYDPPAVQGTANPMALDGWAQGFCTNATSSCSATITTSHANDIIIVYASETLDLQTTCSFTVSDTAGLAWFSRGPNISGRGGDDQLQEFWARSPNALTSDVVTESIAGCGNNYNGLEVFGITGANLSIPFDPSFGAQATGSDATGGQRYATSATISTGNPNDFVFAGVQHGTGAAPTVQSGFTLIISTGGYGTEYKLTSSTLANYTISFSFGTASYWQEIADAVQSTPPTRWLTSTRAYDIYGNPRSLTDPRGNVTSYGYSSKYQSAYLTSLNQTLVPSGTLISSHYGYNFTTGTTLWAQQPNGYNSNKYNTTYIYDVLGRPTRINYPFGAQKYTLIFQGYDYDGGGEHTLTLNGQTLALVPAVNSPQNAGKYVSFTVPMTSLVVQGTNTLVFTHANWDCPVVDNTKNLVVLSNTTLVFSDPTVHPLSCTQSITYVFIVGPDYAAYVYNDHANYVNMTNENGWRIQQLYDGLGRLVTTNRFLVGVAPYSSQTSAYNGVNQVRTSTDALGNTVTYQYDALGRIKTITQPDGNFTQQFYNDTASWIRFTDQYLNYRCSIYDRLGRLLSVIEAADIKCQTGIVTNYAYDEVGDLVRVTNANQKPTLYTYDNLNRFMQSSYADGTSESYSYDNGGNLVKKIDRNSVKTLLSYDSLSRPTTISYCGNPIFSQSYTYDPNSNLLSLQNHNATVSYIYDTRNRTLNETYAVNPSTRQVVDLGCFGSGGTSTASGGISRTYKVGMLYSGETVGLITYPTTTGTSKDINVTYTYDQLGRVLNVTQLGNSTYYARSFTYYKNDQLKGLQYGNSLVENFTYDRVARPLTIALTGRTTMSLTYAYNKTGTVSSIVGAVNGTTVNEQYRYDPLQRLINAAVRSNGGNTTLSYQYDNVGNKLTQNVNGTTTTYTYNLANNELTGSSTPGTTVTYAYDKNGNLLNRNVTTGGTVRWYYAWEASNHLSKVTNSSGQALYAYDGNGRRVEALESGATSYFAYLGTEIIFKNLLSTSNSAYVFAAGMRISVVVNVNGGTYYYHADALGSIRLVTYSDASCVYANGYLPFGKDNGTPKGSLKNSETDKFTGKPYSQATGLYYYYQRWYDPSIGRFISPDQGSGSDYTSFLNSPTSYIDPDGSSPFYALSASLTIISAAVIAASIGYVPRSSLRVKWNPGAREGKFHVLVEVIDTNLTGKASILWKVDTGPETRTGYHVGGWDPTLGKYGRMSHPPGEGYDIGRGRFLKGFSFLERGQEYLGYAAIALTAFDIGSTAYSDYQSGQGYGRTEHEAAVQAVGWAGAWLGGELGAAFGAELGAEIGPGGLVAGGIIGGFIGSIVGFTYGAQAVEDWGNPNAHHGYSGPPPCEFLNSYIYASPPACGDSGSL